ncbi:MAG: LicD family protein [Candidatus Thorarchaeota archaeon]|jgi:hypothetical protein
MITPLLLKAIQEATKDRDAARPFFRKLIHLLNVHKIDYVADSGTLLGAIRDQEEILWDDDFDIYMTRGNIEALNHVIKKGITFTTDETYEPYAVRGFDYHFEFSPIGDNEAKRIDFFNIIAVTNETNEFVPIHICDIFYEGDNSGWPHPTIAELYPIRKARLGDIEVSVPNRAKEYLERVFGYECMTEYTLCNKYLYEKGWHPSEKEEYKVIGKPTYEKLKQQFMTHLAVESRIRSAKKEKEKEEENKTDTENAEMHPEEHVNQPITNSHQKTPQSAPAPRASPAPEPKSKVPASVDQDQKQIIAQLRQKIQEMQQKQNEKLFKIQRVHQQQVEQMQRQHQQSMESMQKAHQNDIEQMHHLLREQASQMSLSVQETDNTVATELDAVDSNDTENRQRYLDAKAKGKQSLTANEEKTEEEVTVEADNAEADVEGSNDEISNEEQPDTDTKDEEADTKNEEADSEIASEQDNPEDGENIESPDSSAVTEPPPPDVSEQTVTEEGEKPIQKEVANEISTKQPKKKKGRGKNNTVSVDLAE